MISIKNTQTDVSLDVPTIRQQLEKIRTLINFSECDINVWFSTPDEIRLLNKRFRNKDEVTDIISFPYHETITPTTPVTLLGKDECILGDIIICPSYIEKDAPRYKQSFENRLRDLLVHGTLHLIGYDHITDEDYYTMNTKEQEIITQL